MTIGPNAQAIVNSLPGRPAEVIAREPNEVQAVFRAFFNGAFTPGRTDARGRIECGHTDSALGWPHAWRRLRTLGLIEYDRMPIDGAVKLVTPNRWANQAIHWKITADGWLVRMDDVAWMTEYLAAKQADEATKQ